MQRRPEAANRISACSSSGLPRLQDAACDFLGELRGSGFEVLFGVIGFASDSIFRGVHIGRSFIASGFEKFGTFLGEFFAAGLELGVDLAFGMAQRLFIQLRFFSGNGLGGFRFFLCAKGARVALRHYAKERPEEEKFKNEIENQNDDRYGHSPEKEFADLVNQTWHQIRLFRLKISGWQPRRFPTRRSVRWAWSCLLELLFITSGASFRQRSEA